MSVEIEEQSLNGHQRVDPDAALIGPQSPKTVHLPDKRQRMEPTQEPETPSSAWLWGPC